MVVELGRVSRSSASARSELLTAEEVQARAKVPPSLRWAQMRPHAYAYARTMTIQHERGLVYDGGVSAMSSPFLLHLFGRSFVLASTHPVCAPCSSA